MSIHTAVSNPQTSPASLALVAACGAGVLWGTGALVVNVLVEKHGFTPANVSFWRFVIGAVVLMAVFGRSISWGRLRPLIGTVLMAGVAMAGYVLLWFLGIEGTSLVSISRHRDCSSCAACVQLGCCPSKADGANRGDAS